ncbi:MAG: hybrid sensor histidine kinase/response regulator [Anaerolineaceae bacterium]|nr:hybrid sensor histidine kinase/response regulator [Anaerolineaceae bacterium]
MSPDPKSIVVVDDTPENLRLLVNMLSEQGYVVRPAPNGQLAISSIMKSPPDLILLDILMPELDGFEVCRQLKMIDLVNDIPVIFVSALDEVFDKVQAFAVGGVDYITKPFQVEEVLARVETHLSLRAMRQQLQKQNQELEAFAHTVAHDLKNPLSILISLFEMQKMDAEQGDKLPDDLFQIGSQTAYRMVNIIDELLLLSSVRKEDVDISPIHDMGNIVQHTVDRLHAMIDQYQAELFIQSEWPTALGYGPWIEEVWINYLSNAMKYGGTPALIEVGADVLQDNLACFWVRDNGPGLTQPEQATLFTEFTRLDKIRANGHGLGLSIVRRIVDKLGGQVGVESETGQGSLFYFELPIA